MRGVNGGPWLSVARRRRFESEESETAPKETKEAPAPATQPAPGGEPAPPADKPAKRAPGAKGKEGKEGKEAKEPKGKARAGPGAKPSKVIPDNPNFRYIVRIANTDLDGTRPVALALTGVRGVGLRVAEVACHLASVGASEMIGNLPEATVEGLESTLGELTSRVPPWMVNHPHEPMVGESPHLFGPDLETRRRDYINQMKMIRSYRGVRHERGQKVRGQRTRSNGRTGMAAGVLKKAAKEAAAKEASETTTAAKKE